MGVGCLHASHLLASHSSLFAVVDVVCIKSQVNSITAKCKHVPQRASVGVCVVFSTAVSSQPAKCTVTVTCSVRTMRRDEKGKTADQGRQKVTSRLIVPMKARIHKYLEKQTHPSIHALIQSLTDKNETKEWQMMLCCSILITTSRNIVNIPTVCRTLYTHCFCKTRDGRRRRQNK